MTVSISHFLKNATLEMMGCGVRSIVRGLVGLWLCVLLMAAGQGTAHATEITQLRVERAEDGIFLSAAARFELPPVVEDALLKGIPMFFVVEADIYRHRWYWSDARVASAVRTMRLAYQPLTRRWRVNIASGLIANSAGLRATLNQNYETLAEALSAIQRVARWKIAESGDVERDAAYKLEFSFRLDLSQLPRPFQIGMAGQREWDISARVTEPLKLELPASTEGSR
jgi:Domain of unknown function (DUF4390)